MPPMDFTVAGPRCAVHDAYCAYYGLDVDVDRPQVDYHLGYLICDTFRLATHYYRQPGSRGTAFLLHGFFDHAGLYSRLITHCLDQQLDVLIFDLPGHGLSSGEQASIRSFTQYRRVLGQVMDASRPHVKQPWVAVGQSTGGALLIDYLLMHGHDRRSSAFAAVVLLAPLIRPAGFSSVKVLHSVLKPFFRTWKRGFALNSSDPAFVHFQQYHDPLQSQVLAVEWVSALRKWVNQIEAAAPVKFHLTVIQGEQDTTVAWRHNLRVLRRKFSYVQVFQIAQGRHHLVNESGPILAAVFDAVNQAFDKVLPPVETPQEPTSE
ncbi:MAG: alpha/beta hydrolase [Halomonadaceae bacterium]|nr:MAG: alpha/beta hydrolase [Halomonadaceae bacterium]